MLAVVIITVIITAVLCLGLIGLSDSALFGGLDIFKRITPPLKVFLMFIFMGGQITFVCVFVACVEENLKYRKSI